jgi:hypothetical protein
MPHGFPAGRTRSAPPAGFGASGARLGGSGGQPDAESDARRGCVIPKDLNLSHVAVELTDADLQDAAASVGDIHRCQATAPRLRDSAQDDGVAFGAAREKGERATHELEDFLDVLIAGHWRGPSPAIPVATTIAPRGRPSRLPGETIRRAAL